MSKLKIDAPQLDGVCYADGTLATVWPHDDLPPVSCRLIRESDYRRIVAVANAVGEDIIAGNINSASLTGRQHAALRAHLAKPRKGKRT